MHTLDQLAAGARVTVRRSGPPNPQGTCIVYWMQRAQRGIDNPALDIAVECANILGKPVIVFFAPVPLQPANVRHYQFLQEGIPDIARDLQRRNVGFVLRRFPEHGLVKFCHEVNPSLVIGDENPLRGPESWRVRAAAKLKVPLWTVDADVIVPSKLLEKEQYGAHTIRPRLRAQLSKFLVPSEEAKARVPWSRPTNVASLAVNAEVVTGWNMGASVNPVNTLRGGTREALRWLKDFVESKLPLYSKQRNHPELDGTSRLSPYLHFGQLGPRTVALAAQNAKALPSEKNAFLDQLITWRELAVNLVRFNPLYDTFECAPAWAQRTLAKHASDHRPVLYNQRQLENAETHDPLWNAAQRQMVNTGWMHNYMRMYWGKKILEWSPSVQQAYQTAVYLNDKYELDGRDPNGYAGIAWCMVGKFDRPWFERPIFGQIRYMSFESTRRKFDSKRYIEQNS